jgi:hypothetical protein
MAAGLAKVGIHGAFEGALRYVGNPELVSRTHFARYLVETGLCPDTHSVFRRYLTPGHPGYVPFRWARLENLIGSAALQQQLDLEGLLDQVIDFLFSPTGGLLRRQLVDAAVERMDALAWRTTLRLGQRLPRALQPPGLRNRPIDPVLEAGPVLDLEPLQQLAAILRDLPGFEPSMLLRRLPRVLGEAELRRMGFDVARGLAERGVVRLLRDVLLPPEGVGFPPLASA